MSEIFENKPSVLYVDDIQSNLILFSETLKGDYNIILAETAMEALEILREKDIQVLVSDQRMPGMTGTELLEIVARDYPDTRRFLLSAFTDFETVVEAVNKGQIHGYITKPLNEDEVKISINSSLEIYYLQKENQSMLKELEKANIELMNLDGLKSEIIKMISHEIRNPLNRIMGTLHFLKDKIEGQDLSEVVNILDNSVSRLEEFSTMTEQISMLKSPGHKMKFSEVHFNQVIEYSMIETSEGMKGKNIRINLLNNAGNSTISGEPYLAVNCLVNMLRYAAEHCVSGGSITIETKNLNEKFICEVIDQGKGYEEGQFEDMTIQFSPGNAKLSLNLGIELALAQMIMVSHNGKILFEKTGDGRGVLKMVFPTLVPL